jgi:hypothetical protein
MEIVVVDERGGGGLRGRKKKKIPAEMCTKREQHVLKTVTEWRTYKKCRL